MLGRIGQGIYVTMENNVNNCTKMAEQYQDPIRSNIDAHMWPVFKQVRYVQIDKNAKLSQGKILLIPFNKDGYHIELVSKKDFRGLRTWLPHLL